MPLLTFYALLTTVSLICLTAYTFHLRGELRDTCTDLDACEAHCETKRQEIERLRGQVSMYQNELKEVRNKCVALRERIQVTEGWGENSVALLGKIYADLSRKGVLNRLPLRFVGIVKAIEQHIKNRAKAVTQAKIGL